MHNKKWIEQLKEDELSHRFLLSNLENQYPNTEIIDEFADTALVILQKNGIDQTASFYTKDDESLKKIANWFKGRDLIIEAPYDRMVQLLASVGEKKPPNRFYLLKHDDSEKEIVEKRLDYRLITEIDGNEKILRTGLKAVYQLNKREIADLFINPLFIDYLKRGVHIFTCDQKLVGSVQVKNQTDNYAEISNLWVRKKLRGKGYSNEIVQIMIQLFRKKGQRCLVTLSRDSYGMLRFFENEDFEMVRVLGRDQIK
jgi:ribosomal protein S18 acetylase RimI-like enzyme